MKASNTSHF